MRRGGACSKEKLFHTLERRNCQLDCWRGFGKSSSHLNEEMEGKACVCFQVASTWSETTLYEKLRGKRFFSIRCDKKKLIWSPNMKIFEMLFELFSSHQEHDNQFLYQLVNHFTHIIWHWGRQGIHRKNKCRSDVILSIRNLLDRE